MKAFSCPALLICEVSHSTEAEMKRCDIIPETKFDATQRNVNWLLSNLKTAFLAKIIKVIE